MVQLFWRTHVRKLSATPALGTLNRLYKYRLYPTAAQARRLESWQVRCWELQKLCIQQRRWAWRNLTTLYAGKQGKQRLPSQASQQREMTQVRQSAAKWREVPAVVLGNIVWRVEDAYAHMRQHIKEGKPGGRPHWPRCPALVGLTFRGDRSHQGRKGTHLAAIRGRFAFVVLADAGSLGALRIRYHRPLPDGALIKEAHVTCAADGWYLSLSCVIPAPDPPPPASKDVNGVDLGCIHQGDQQRVAAVDDGRIYTSTDHLKRNQQRLTTLQRLVDPKRKVRGTAKAADPRSKRTARRRAKIRRLHQRIARQREHTAQYIARRLVDTANTVAFEDIDWTALRSNGKRRHKALADGPKPTRGDKRRARKRGGRRAKRGLNRAMSTAAPGRLIALTREKAAAAGRQVLTVSPRNTSQLCSACGAVGTRKSLTVRVWTCAVCGATHDRDINAARNIRQRAIINNPTQPACSRGLRGEGAAPDGSEGRSMNREEAPSLTARETRQRSHQAGVEEPCVVQLTLHLLVQ